MRTAAQFVGVCVVGIATATPAAVAEDWPHLRGPQYDGVCRDTTLDLAQIRRGPPLLWKRKLGSGYSGFTVAGPHAYTQFQTRAGQFVACLDLETGAVLWQTRYGWPWGTLGHYPGTYGTPTLDRGKVFYSDCYGAVGCLDAATGRPVWRVDLARTFGVKVPGFGYACTPLVLHDRVYVFVGDKPSVAAFHAGDGALLWTAGEGDIGYGSPFPVTAAGRLQVVSFLDNVLLAHDPETGRELWRHDWSHGYDPHPAWPVYADPYLFCASAFCRGSRALRLSGGEGRASAELAWRNRKLSNDILSCVIVNGHVYGFDIRDPQSVFTGKTRGMFKCLDLATGEERWRTDGIGHASVLACGTQLLILNENGILVVAEATPAAYRELARVPLLPGELCWTQPTLSRGFLLVRSQEHVACVYLGDPRNLTRRPLGWVGRRSLDAAVTDWLDRWQDESLWAPTFRQLTSWYLLNVLGVFGVAWIAARAVSRSVRSERRVFAGLSLALALCGVPLFSMVVHEFVFTWPAALYTLFQAVVNGYAQAHSQPTRRRIVVARLELLIFAAICLGFYVLCRRWYVIAGYGFLVGFLFAWPATIAAARRPVGNGQRARTYALEWLAFTLYFWVSGLFVLWKARLTLVVPNVLT